MVCLMYVPNEVDEEVTVVVILGIRNFSIFIFINKIIYDHTGGSQGFVAHVKHTQL